MPFFLFQFSLMEMWYLDYFWWIHFYDDIKSESSLCSLWKYPLQNWFTENNGVFVGSLKRASLVTDFISGVFFLGTKCSPNYWLELIELLFATVTQSLQSKLSIVFSLNEALEHVTGAIGLCWHLDRKRRGGGRRGDSSLHPFYRTFQQF